jgi:hypothetical protein
MAGSEPVKIIAARVSRHPLLLFAISIERGSTQVKKAPGIHRDRCRTRGAPYKFHER